MTWTEKDLNKMYEDMTAEMTGQLRLTRPMVGGIAADKEGVAAFVRNQMKITDPKRVAAEVERILTHEIGERDDTPEGGDVEEKKVYQVSVIRQNEHGPWAGDWMLKALFKQAGTQCNTFVKKKYSKGNLAEAGLLSAFGPSLKRNRWELYGVDDDGKPVQTFFEEFKGSVGTPRGRRSIVSHRECFPIGTNFHFRFRWVDRSLKANDLAELIAMARVVGFGSCKPYERGKFEIVSLTCDGEQQV